jgi:hypothetical protein
VRPAAAWCRLLPLAANALMRFALPGFLRLPKASRFRLFQLSRPFPQPLFRRFMCKSPNRHHPALRLFLQLPPMHQRHLKAVERSPALKLREDSPPSDESRKAIQAVINPQGDIYSGMTKRVAISDGTHTPGLNVSGGKRRSRKG